MSINSISLSPSKARPQIVSELIQLFANPLLRFLVVAMATVHVFDITSTATLFEQGGTELNPVSAFVLHHAGIGGLALEKLTVLGVSVVLMAQVPRWVAAVGALGAIAVTAMAVSFNLGQVF